MRYCIGMDNETKQAIRNTVVTLTSALNEVTERNLVMYETLRGLLPDFDRIYGEKYQARKSQQNAELFRQPSPEPSPAIALLDELLEKL